MSKLTETLSGLRQFLAGLHPAKIAFFGYSTYMILGWLLLCLPFSQKGAGVGALDNLFIAVSALSTTGLATVSVSDSYSFFGQLVVLILIQLGGVGYMTLGSFVILSRKSDLSELRSKVGQTVFSLPTSFRIDKFIRSVVVFTFLIELVGIIPLYFIFREAGDPSPAWSAAFHSISAFCTAGFSLYNNSFESYAGHFWLNSVVGALSFLGAIGFIVFVDIWRKVRGKVRTVTLTSRIILWASFWLILGGTILLFIAEPSIRERPTDERLLTAFFQAMTAMTTVGFNTIPIAELSRASVLLVIVLMVIGASPSGTGGGVKCTALSAILGVMRSAIRGEKDVRFWGRQVPLERVWMGVASVGFYLVFLVIGTYLLEMTESTPFDKNLFEAASALGTVGLSMGITPELTNIGKVIITGLMFLGRLGPLTFGIALFCAPGAEDIQDNDLAV
ncbi:MAG: potassium transporter KtrB [Candidatus Omnitrophica bacterium]|nr:Ktr system potassium uptake protein B [bacterium]NUN95092.1 potassium transporter KtrB [Candidatus Omnitrophota bacterium]